MNDRERESGLTVLAGAGIAAALVIGGVGLLALTVRLAAAPLGAFRIAGGDGATESAIIVTTRNPSTPWPTATQVPTLIAWNAPTATAHPPVEPLAEWKTSDAPPLASPAPVQDALLPTDVGTPPLPPSASPTTVTATPVFVEEAQTATLPPASVAAPPEAPVATSTIPTEASPPPSATLLPEGSVEWYNDLADLETFVRRNRGTIAGRPLDILSLTRTEPAPDTVARFTLELSASETDDVLAAQSREDLLLYGEWLLDDVKRYQGGEPCELVVKSSYEVSATSACTEIPDWCTVEGGNPSAGVWTITRVYLRGSFDGGDDTVTTWRAAP